METYTLLRTVPVFADVRRRVRKSYHSLKHVHASLRLGLQLVEVFFQLVLLFSWPLIIFCYLPIVVTDRVLHHTLALIIEYFPAVTAPAPQVYDMVFAYTMSFTIGRVIVFFLLLASYIVFFIIECGKVAVNFLMFFTAPFTGDEDPALQALRLSPPSPRFGRYSHVPRGFFSPAPPVIPPTPTPQSPPQSPPPTVVLPGAEQGPVRVVEAVTREVSIQDVGPGRQLQEPLLLRPPPRRVRMVVPVERPLQCVAQ